MRDITPPSVRFATTADRKRIAYAVAGSGPPLVFVRALNSHAEHCWSDPWTGRYFAALAQGFQVIVYDTRGNGLSDRSGVIDLDGLLTDLGAVISTLGLERVTLYGQGFGTPVALAFTARQKELVERLIVYCAYARGDGVQISSQVVDTMRTVPDAAAALMARSSYPDAEELPTRLLGPRHLYTDPETAANFLDFARTVDVEADLASINAPTLVMQPERSPVVPSRLGREVAAAVPNATFVPIPGGAYNPWAEGAVEPTLRAIESFTQTSLPFDPPTQRRGGGGTVAVLFTDMEDSTAMTSALGDRAAQDVVREHDRIVRRAIKAHSGREVKHTGDGIMACFPPVSAAVACAVEIQREVLAQSSSFRVRIGIHAGEPLWEDDNPQGTVVQTARRVCEEADAGQILVSDIVRRLVSGKEIPFREIGTSELKGLPEPVRLFDVDWGTST